MSSVAWVLLLLPKQVLEARSLFRRKDFPELVPGVLQLVGQQGADGLHDLPGVLLALTENAVDPFVLFGRQVEFLLHAAEQFQFEAARRGGERWGDGPHGCCLSKTGGGMQPGEVLNQQTAGHHAGAENDHGGENDLPVIHQEKS